MKKTFAVAFLVLVAGIAVAAGSAGPTERNGALHVTKTCPEYHGLADESCTITSSSINAIKPGSRVVYASAVNALGLLDSDLVIDGPGNNDAYGHVVLDLSTFSGVVTFSGGTGEFRHFHAGPLAVACPNFAVDANCSWDGPYSFEPRD